MADNVKQLKKDRNEVKKELKNLTRKFESLRAKMVDKSDYALSPSSANVQHLSDGYLQWLLNNYWELSEEIK